MKNALRSHTNSIDNAGRGQHRTCVNVKPMLIGGTIIIDDVSLLFAASVDSPIVTIEWFVVSAHITIN